MKRSFVLALLMVLMCVGFAQAQTTVTGKVTDAKTGEPVPFASVVVPGTTIGVTADENGVYFIDVPSGATSLKVSSVGFNDFEQEIAGRTQLDIKVEPEAVRLDEVVVTALGMKKERKALGYAAQDVKGDDLTRANNPNMMGALQGKVAGVDITPSSGMPGASSQVVIRGARSFTGDNTPLYVIDGMPIASTSPISTESSVTGADFSNRAIDIDPNDIESINVLRGQSAAALYGIRASNGVIIITTKSGKGLQKGKPVVTFNVSGSFDIVSRKPEFQTEWAQGTGGKYVPNSSANYGPRISDLPNDADYGGNTKNKYNGNDDQKYRGKYYVPQRAEAGLDPWVTPGTYDNFDDFFETGYTLNTSANVSQAGNMGNYSMGIGHMKQEGIVPSTWGNRTSAKGSADMNLNKYWKAGFSANYIQNGMNKIPGANEGVLGAIYGAPASYDLKGIPMSPLTDPYSQIHFRPVSFGNPYWLQTYNKFLEKTNRFFGNGYVEFEPNLGWEGKKLSFRYQLGADTYTTHYQDIYAYGHQGGSGKIINRGITNTTYNSLLTATFDWKIAEDWNFNIMVGNEFDQNNFKYYRQNGTNFNFGGWSHIQNTTVQTGLEEQSQKRTVGFFGNASLDYKSMVFLNVTGRNDVVSNMPRNNRSFFYPSVSASFVFTELAALKGNNVLSFGKVRASYAQVGQAADAYYQDYFTVPTYSGGFWTGNAIAEYPIGGVTSYRQYRRRYDPKLKPQNTESYEFGAELRFFNNLFGIDYTFARQNVKDQIFEVPLAGSTGAAELVTNGGKIHTNSHEIVLTVSPIRTNDIDWSIGVNFTKMDNYVDELASGVNSITLGGFTTPQVRLSKGEKFPVIYGQQFARDGQGRILVDDQEFRTDGTKNPGYGLPYAGNETIIGRVSPDFTMGANTSFRYKRITASATFAWKNGGQMYSGTNGLMYVYGTSGLTADRTNPFVYAGYKSDGTPNDIQRGGEDDQAAYERYYGTTLGNIAEAYIMENSFVKLREATLGYSLPKLAGIDISINVFVRNVLIWSKLPNLDPESSQGNNNMAGSFERLSPPQTKSFGGGLTIKF